MEINDCDFSEIRVGSIFQFNKKITKEDVKSFAKLTGDFNPLHLDEEFAKKSILRKTIIHGMLAGSLFSTLVGMVCPGKRNFYLSQSLKFKEPISPESDLVVKGEIIEKIEGIRVVIIKTTISVDKMIAVEGEAKVKVLENLE